MYYITSSIHLLMCIKVVLLPVNSTSLHMDTKSVFQFFVFFFWNLHADFLSVHQFSFLPGMQVPSPSLPPEFSLLFLIIAILTEARWILNVILICFSLTNDVEHLFIYLLAACISLFFLELFSSFAHSLILCLFDTFF